MNKTVFIVENSGDVSHLDYESCNYLVAVDSVTAQDIKTAQTNTPSDKKFNLNQDGSWFYSDLPQNEAVETLRNNELEWAKSEYQNEMLNLDLHHIAHEDARGAFNQVRAYLREVYDFSKQVDGLTEGDQMPARPEKDY